MNEVKSGRGLQAWTPIPDFAALIRATSYPPASFAAVVTVTLRCPREARASKGEGPLRLGCILRGSLPIAPQDDGGHSSHFRW